MLRTFVSTGPKIENNWNKDVGRVEKYCPESY